MTDERERWALILGASSGMGEATSRALAAQGYRILGVHLDFRAALGHVEEVKAAIAEAGRATFQTRISLSSPRQR